MIAVADLLNKDRLPGNYFAPDAYVQGDFELGLLENRQGNRLIALPDTLLQALYSSLEEEVGAAAGLVMFQCGHWWGKYFYRRFAEEVSTYYGTPLAEMEMVEFLQCLKQCWKTYGWGNLNLDFGYYDQGFIIATVENSAFAEVRQKSDTPAEKPACYAEAGLLSTFFSQLTGQDLHCVQTACESMGAAQNVFILGLEERLKVAEACIEEQQDHDTAMMRLGLDQPVVSEPDMPESAVSESAAPAPTVEPESLMSAGFFETSEELAAAVPATAEGLPEQSIEAPVAEAPVTPIAEAPIAEAPAAEAPAAEAPAVEEMLSEQSIEALENLANLDFDDLEVSDDLEAPAEPLAKSSESSVPDEQPVAEAADVIEAAAPERVAELQETEPPKPESPELELSLDSLDALENLAELDLDGLEGLEDLDALENLEV